MIRPRTLRRLGAFLLIAGLLAAVALVLNEQRSRREAANLLQQRNLGMEALTRGDYEAALGALRNYLTGFDSREAEADFEARLGYAAARARVSEAGERHLEQAGRILRDLASDVPDRARALVALHLLMEVTAVGREWQELRRQCDEALARYPSDRFSLAMRCEALEQLGEYQGALADSEALLALVPGDVDEQLRSLQLRRRLGEEPQALVARAVEMATRNATDPRFLLVLAIAYVNAGQAEQALTCLRQASQSELPGDGQAAFILRLAGLFDALGKHLEAQAAYARALEQLSLSDEARDELRPLLALRLWQVGQLDEALTLLEGDPMASSAQVVLIATRTMLLFEKGDVAQARQRLATLGRIVEMPDRPAQRREALAWYEALSAAYVPGDRSPRDRLEMLLSSQARTADLRDLPGLLQFDRPAGLMMKWTGDRYSELGEPEQAVEYWRRASERLPGWEEPLLLVAQAATEMKLIDAAQEAATLAEALAAQRSRPRLEGLKVQIAYRHWLLRPSAVRAMRVAALAWAHQLSNPLHPSSLPAHVHMIALGDPLEASRLIRQQFQLGADVSLCLALAEVSRLAGLGLDAELLSPSPTPEAGLLRARAVAHSGDVPAALAILELDAGSQDEVGWRVAQARLLSELALDEAASAWRELAHANPTDLKVQLALLEQRELLSRHPELALQGIDRVFQLTGPAARRWRLERARWLLAQRTRASALDAAELLKGLIRQTGGGPESIEPRVLLAEALLQVGVTQVAREHLEAAYALDEARGDVGLRLLELYEREGVQQEALALLLQMAAAGIGPVEARAAVAEKLVALGKDEVAISLLRQARSTGQLHEQGERTLAVALQLAGRQREAEAVFADLGGPEAHAETLIAAARFWAMIGRREDAEALVIRLGRPDLPDVQRHQARASLLSGMGDYQRARNALALALARMPESPDTWADAAILELSCNDPVAAVDILSRAKDAGVDSPSMAVLALEAQVLSSAPEADFAEQLEALAVALAGFNEFTLPAGLSESLHAAATALREQHVPAPDELIRLERAAELFLHFRPVHAALESFYRLKQMPAERVRAACRAAMVLPHDPVAQRMAFEACKDAGMAARARHFALSWNRSAGADPLDSAAAIAQGHLLSGDADAANEAITPHVAELVATGSEMLVAEIQAACGDYSGAWARISPHLSQSSPWRAVAVRSAATRITRLSEARRWLETVALLHEAELGAQEADGQERLDLARAFSRLGERLRDRDALEQGRLRLNQLVAGPLAQNPAAWESLADAELALGNSEAAEAALRRVMALDLRRSVAAGKLARLLLNSPDSADKPEALNWATLAVEQEPDNPGLHATLGRVHLATKAYPSAQAAFERALHLDERNLDARLGLARTFVDSGEGATAARLFADLRLTFRDADSHAPELEGDFTALNSLFGSAP